MPTNPFIKLRLVALLITAAGGAACSDDEGEDAVTTGGAGGQATGGTGGTGASPAMATAHTLFATEGETLVSFDIASGLARTGAIANVKGPTDLQALDSGHLLVNLTSNNEILVVDGRTFREVARIKSSSAGATRPVHGFITPPTGGKQFWVAMNDGEGTASTNSVVLVDVVPGSATFLQPVGELGLGIGHHKAAFSRGKARVSVSNIADCGNVLQVIDYADASKPTLVKAWSAAELDDKRACTPMAGVGPHGAAAAANGRGYHNLTGWGAIAAVDQEATPPAVKVLSTQGAGAGYTKAGKDGRYIYSLQRAPREGDAMRPGADCQVGQLVVIDSMTDTIAAEAPILLAGPGCTAKLPAHTTGAGPDHIKITRDGKTMFVTTQASPPMGSTAEAHSDQLVVFDLSNPAAPVQKPSLTVGKHSGHRAMALSGDDKVLFVVNANDKTISQIDVAALAVTRTLTLKDVPRQVTTWGSAEGPGAQTGPQ